MVSKTWIQLPAAFCLIAACGDDGAAITGESGTGDESSSDEGQTVTITVTGADTSTAGPTTDASSSESTSADTSGSESGGGCGNAMLDDGEVCDGTELGDATCESEGFASGTLACAADCTAFDTSMCVACGNGAIDDGEDCD